MITRWLMILLFALAMPASYAQGLFLYHKGLQQPEEKAALLASLLGDEFPMHFYSKNYTQRKGTVVLIGANSINDFYRKGFTYPHIALDISPATFNNIQQQHCATACAGLVSVIYNTSTVLHLQTLQSSLSPEYSGPILVPLSSTVIPQPNIKLIEKVSDISLHTSQHPELNSLFLTAEMEALFANNLYTLVTDMYHQNVLLFGYSEMALNMGTIASVFPTLAQQVNVLKKVLQQLKDNHATQQQHYVCEQSFEVNPAVFSAYDTQLPIDKIKAALINATRRCLVESRAYHKKG
ncbi:hypothetical protein [Flocculibacter collagenilyticus]|uniref:hypothetical protein n=1 Tax=Flocculibacter collagenilyticus TaxID=2744479 RepID=UPI0018F7208B|nr:hypothetical protein [Flocculibacter collagenilyticus]